MGKEICIQLLIEFSPLEYQGAMVDIPVTPQSDIPIKKEVIVTK